jgi:ABC-2 type transport system permease protein
MIPPLVRIAWISLSRDRAVQALTFVLPIVFFSIFAGVFGRQMDDDATPRVRVAVVNEDTTQTSRSLVAALAREEGLRVRTTVRADGDTTLVPITAARGEQMVRDGDVAVAIVVPLGYGESFGRIGEQGAAIRLLADRADPVAPHLVAGLLQKSAMLAAPQQLARGGLDQFERYGVPVTPEQRAALERWTAESPADTAAAGAAGDSAGGDFSFVRTETVDVLGETKKNPAVALLAAGIAVMFLLFMSRGAGGSLLEEVQTGTLERLLTSRVGMGRLLFGKWLFTMLLGVLQVTVMFLWGWAVFRLELFAHLPGFLVMTVVSAATAAAFGIVLATACRTEGQLNAISTIVILTMSAIGGSMFPRFFMSETLQKIGLVTFNAWALDGYTKVFWRDAPVTALWPQLAMLAAFTVLFALIARRLARRWETA